jgi:hypothetical protein
MSYRDVSPSNDPVRKTMLFVDNVGSIRKAECTLKSDWGTLVPRIDVENGIKLGFVLEYIYFVH